MNRFVNASFAAISIGIVAPMLVILWILVALTFRRNPIVVQPVYSIDGHTIHCYELLTSTEESRGNFWGTVLKATNLHKLPGLFNVALGECSFTRFLRVNDDQN